MKIPAPLPSASPAPVQALAEASRCAGMYSASSLAVAGNAVLSPSPSTSRSTNSAAKLPASPVSNVASDHSARPSASVR